MNNNIMPPSNEIGIGLSQGQIGVLQDMLGHGLRKSTVFQDTPTEEVDRFVKTAGPELRDVWVELTEKRFQDFVGCFRVPVNYDETDAIAKAFEAAKFDGRYGDVPTSEIPLVGSGQTIHLVREVHFGRVMYNRNLPAALKERGQSLGFKTGLKFADPLTALRFAGVNQDRQRKYPLGILFYNSKGRLCYLCLLGHVAERWVSVCQDSPDDGWDGGVRFLAVCELPLVAF